jgi:hypothetical protein
MNADFAKLMAGHVKLDIWARLVLAVRPIRNKVKHAEQYHAPAVSPWLNCSLRAWSIGNCCSRLDSLCVRCLSSSVLVAVAWPLSEVGK